MVAIALHRRNRFFILLLNLYGMLRRRYEAWSYHSDSVFQIQEGNDYIRSVIHEDLPSAIGKIGSVEIIHQSKAHDLSSTNRYVRITRKVAVNLIGEEHGRDN